MIIYSVRDIFLGTRNVPSVHLSNSISFSDITIPGSNTSSDSGPSKIPAGETVLVIKTPRGVYIRTPQGKIFAVRAGTKGLGGDTSALGTTKTSATSLLTSNSKAMGVTGGLAGFPDHT